MEGLAFSSEVVPVTTELFHLRFNPSALRRVVEGLPKNYFSPPRLLNLAAGPLENVKISLNTILLPAPTTQSGLMCGTYRLKVRVVKKDQSFVDSSLRLSGDCEVGYERLKISELAHPSFRGERITVEGTEISILSAKSEPALGSFWSVGGAKIKDSYIYLMPNSKEVDCQPFFLPVFIP